MLLLKDAFFAIACVQFLLIYDSEAICGRPYYKPYLPSDDRGANRITNGIEARKHSHPWQAFVLTGTIRPFKSCGGSLIHWKEGNTSDLVLTAAHCVVNMSNFEVPSLWEKVSYNFYRLFDKHEKHGPLENVSNVHVFLGAHDVNLLASSSMRVAVKEIVVGEFNRIVNHEDIAILKLENEIVYGKSIQGICLPTEDEKEPPSQSPCLVTGWGLIADGKPASKLQQVDAYVFSGKVDAEFFDKTRMICTRGKKRRTGPAYGDSGGPLACIKNNTFVLYGIVSFSISDGCYDVANKYAFMKIPYYLKWLYGMVSRLHARENATSFNATTYNQQKDANRSSHPDKSMS